MLAETCLYKLAEYLLVSGEIFPNLGRVKTAPTLKPGKAVKSSPSLKVLAHHVRGESRAALS